MLTKLDLMKLVLPEEKLRQCDTAIPHAYVQHMNEQMKSVGIEFDSSLHVTDCSGAFPKLINLAELLISSGKLEEILGELQRLTYINKVNIKKDKATGR